MASWLSPAQTIPVAAIVRDGKDESVHHGVVAVVDAEGQELFRAGDPSVLVYPRSTLKPLQTLAVLKTGVELSELEIALATSSHSGSEEHRDAVLAFLQHHQLSQSLLQCPADWPLDLAARAALVAAGGEQSVVAMNCSGKHSAFLAACQHAGWDLASYLESHHPLQRSIVNVIENYCGELIEISSVDGCGAPLHAVSVLGLAKGLARLVSDDNPLCQRIVKAVGANPWAISGRGLPNTEVIETVGGIAKIGAEGLVVIALPSGICVAVKILDGSMRATTPVALWALGTVGALEGEVVEQLSQKFSEKVYGGQSVLGRLKVTLT
jgi:L-asparaginase II